MDKPQFEQALQRIAKMEHQGVPSTQIAMACNIDVAQLDKLRESPKYREKLAEIAANEFDKIDVANEGWDIVENLAMNKVVDHLQHAPDPEFALKAAAVANKAARRGRHTNDPIGAQPNTQAVIHVNLQFADKLQEAFVIEQKPATELVKKDDNFLAPNAVNKLLQKADELIKPKIEQEIDQELGDLDLLMARI